MQSATRRRESFSFFSPSRGGSSRIRRGAEEGGLLKLKDRRVWRKSPRTHTNKTCRGGNKKRPSAQQVRACVQNCSVRKKIQLYCGCYLLFCKAHFTVTAFPFPLCVCVCVSATNPTVMIIDQLGGGEKHKHLGLIQKGETLQNNQTEDETNSQSSVFSYLSGHQSCQPLSHMLNEKIGILLFIEITGLNCKSRKQKKVRMDSKKARYLSLLSCRWN